LPSYPVPFIDGSSRTGNGRPIARFAIPRARLPEVKAADVDGVRAVAVAVVSWLCLSEQRAAKPPPVLGFCLVKRNAASESAQHC
jgi:hypothetical protein